MYTDISDLLTIISIVYAETCIALLAYFFIQTLFEVSHSDNLSMSLHSSMVRRHVAPSSGLRKNADMLHFSALYCTMHITPVL